MSERAANQTDNGAESASAESPESAESNGPAGPGTSGTTASSGPQAQTPAPTPTPTASSDSAGAQTAVLAAPSPSAPAPGAAAAPLPALPQAAAPEPEAAQGLLAGRLSSGVLAGAALAGLLLIAAPFGFAQLGDDSPSADSASSREDDLAAGLPPDDEQPGFVPVPAESSASPTVRPPASGTPRSAGNPVSVPYGPATPAPSATNPRTTKPDGGKSGTSSGTKSGTSSGTKSGTKSGTGTVAGSTSPQVATQSAVQPAGTRHLVGQQSGRCVDIPNFQATVGADLQMWDCVQQKNQYWTFRADGTVRAMGLCLTSVWHAGENGSPIQLDTCAGRPQQKWALNSDAALVNPATAKCLDVVDFNTGNGARLQLWSCGGGANQKWTIR
ncbi:ricin-type beta-trefoil lectin domain protein [Streptomyces sp. NPDC000878]